MQRAERLLAQAHAIAPDSDVVFNTYVLWLGSVGRCPEVIEAAEGPSGQTRTGCGSWTGPTMSWRLQGSDGTAERPWRCREGDQLIPLSPWMFIRYRDGLLLSRQDTRSLERLSHEPGNHPDTGHIVSLPQPMPESGACGGQAVQPRQIAYSPMTPFAVISRTIHRTAFCRADQAYQDGCASPANATMPKKTRIRCTGGCCLAQRNRRSHAEDAPGMKTIRTADLTRFLVESRPVVIDTVSYSWGRRFLERSG